jgi:hypothetical protein
MPKKIKPSDISVQVDYDIDAAMDFCAEVLEDLNAHNISYVLDAINRGAYDIAKDLIDLERDQAEAGSLTTELRDRREAILVRLDDFDPEDDEEHVCDDDCRRHGCHRR